jgi:hypothetical protein
MRFKVGDTIHNKVTQEEGRIVRVANATDDSPAGYVVLVAVSPLWRVAPIEALWPETQVKK